MEGKDENSGPFLRAVQVLATMIRWGEGIIRNRGFHFQKACGTAKMLR